MKKSCVKYNEIFPIRFVALTQHIRRQDFCGYTRLRTHTCASDKWRTWDRTIKLITRLPIFREILIYISVHRLVAAVSVPTVSISLLFNPLSFFSLSFLCSALKRNRLWKVYIIYYIVAYYYIFYCTLLL